MDDRAESPPPELIQALRRQLGASGEVVELVETHISWVLMAGDRAWKIKKPVRLGFLDFSSLARRRHFCDEELRLNRRYAPSIYLDVLPIAGTLGAPDLGGNGAPIEFALHMKRFPPRALFSELLADDRLLPAHIDALARRIAALQAQADAAATDSPWGRPADIVSGTAAVLDRLAAQGEAVADLRDWLATQAQALAPLWLQRRRDGWVRECHGDLHLGNAVLLDDGVTAFDCIEFDPALRWIDVQSDIAFMAMDLLAHRRADLAWRFVNAWLDASGDHAGVPLLRFHLAYRALVRALVERLHAPAAGEPLAADYLALARRMALQPPGPRLLVTHGLSGSGKSWLTQGLLEAAGALRLRSDVERKRLFGLAALEDSAARVAGGIYSPGATRRTYAQLLLRAEGMLRAGWPVIVDAASLRRAERERFAGLAAGLGAPYLLLDCQADVTTLRRRVRERATRHDDVSEADTAVLERQFGQDEAPTGAELADVLTVRTDRPLDVAALAATWRARPLSTPAARPGS